jgi:hypothetical protein
MWLKYVMLSLADEAIYFLRAASIRSSLSFNPSSHPILFSLV